MTTEILTTTVSLADTPSHDDALVKCVAAMLPYLRENGVTDPAWKILDESNFGAYPASLTEQPTKYHMFYRVEAGQ